MQKLGLLVVFAMVVSLLPTISVATESVNPLYGNLRNFDGDIIQLGDALPQGNSTVDYMLYEHHGGWWCDAEKTKDNDDDDLLCWAAAATNVLEWTGWGLVDGMWNTDEMFQYCQDYWDDRTGWPTSAWQWWFDGTLADEPGGGNFWPGYTWTDYLHEEYDPALALQAIDEYLHAGNGVAIGVWDGGHVITCWGFRYDDSVDKTIHPGDYYLGVWVTDSDDDKSWVGPAVDAPNNIRYLPVEWNGTNWNLVGGYGGWYISGVCAFEPFPDNNRPVANAGGPYTGNEGSLITFDGSSSSDPDGDPLMYRWDFDNDGLWDTEWSSSPYASHTWSDDYAGTVVLQVRDSHTAGALLDAAMASVTVDNVAPSIVPFGPLTVDEGTLALTATSTDPGSDDLTFTWEFQLGPTISKVYYNDGVGPDPYPSPWGTYPFPATDTAQHTYGDDYVYTVTLTVTDDDGSSDVWSTTVTVNNIAPSITELVMTPPNPDNPEFILPSVHEPLFTASTTDPGSDDLTFTWDWGDGTDDTITYYNDGVGPAPYPSPWGTYPFSVANVLGHVYSEPGMYTVTLTIEDDDGGVNTITCEIKILSAEEALHLINDYIQGLAGDTFKNNPDQRKNSFNNMFSAIDDMLTDGEYEAAIMDLQRNIREKADGTLGGSQKNDWITNATAQEHVCWKIDALIVYLQTLI